MKFNVVIGNPPYNNDMYIDFVELGNQLSTYYTVMITPAKWQAKGGKKNDDFRKNIVPFMSDVVYYPVTQEIFDIRNVDGISYYLIDNEIHLIKSIENKSDKVKYFNNKAIRRIDGMLNNSAYSIVNKASKYSKIFRMKSLDTDLFEVVYNNDTGREYKVISGGKVIGYSRLEDINKNQEWANKIKVVINRVNGNSLYDTNGGTLGLNKVYVLKEDEICPFNYLGIRICNTLDEANSIKSYFNTKLIRFIILSGQTGQGLQELNTWRFVPDPGKFDHIFTDEELYKKYNLTQEEINIIESVIKSRD